MVAAKDKLIEIIDTILRNTSDTQERFALINHRNDRDQTLLDIIASRSRYYGTEGYAQIAQVILSYLDEQQRYIVLNNMKDEYQDVLKAMLAQKIVDNMPDSGLVLVSLVPPAVKKKAKARI